MFKSLNAGHLTKFNSTASMNLLGLYNSFVEEDIQEKNNRPSHKTIAPSSLRCSRRTWFRLRGVESDKLSRVDPVLHFTTEIGSACHEIIQNRLSLHLKDDWLDVGEYLETYVKNHEFTYTKNGYETQIAFHDIPIRFACDGVIRLDDKLYLLEIKSSEFSSWQDLSDCKEEHRQQALCYAMLLGLQNILFMYIDRQYGGIKCFEVIVKDYEAEDINNKFSYILKCVENNIAPEPLPKGDKWCSPAMCPYYKKCGEYGR